MDDAMIDAYCAGTVACYADKRRYADNPYSPTSPEFGAFLEGFQDVPNHLADEAEAERWANTEGSLAEDRGSNAPFSPGCN